ncbi:lipase family protein [Mycobacterium sp. 94-17]|uniref:lipase family protein n=1 Tax=Mycobacterium sp. 94-17 TaxID=2986147 RepID=UPI002D1EF236|nr:lipase family protein [Mycobacterium sp. 94-17]MEB4209913.1 lipase family protein [Mycobacterium sp. 94-17]
MARRDFLRNAVLVGGGAILTPWAGPVISRANAIGPAAEVPTGFDPQFALDVGIPLALAAYSAMSGGPLNLPTGYVATALIQADRVLAASMAEEHPLLAEAVLQNNIFGLLGRNQSTRTAFVAFRGTADRDDVITDLEAIPVPYGFVRGFGLVHDGFHALYRLLRGSIIANLAAACVGCDKILDVGHSLGGALAVVGAPDIFVNMAPHIEPRLLTFAGPRPGLCDFTKAFNRTISTCYRVVNCLDLIPLLPPWPYEQPGVAVKVDSGGSIDPLWRHSLLAYQAGLEKLVQPTG